MSSDCWKDFLGADLIELRMRVEEGHVVIQLQERVFLDFQYFQFEYHESFPDRGCLLELRIAGDFSSGPCRHQGGRWEAW